MIMTTSARVAWLAALACSLPSLSAGAQRATTPDTAGFHSIFDGTRLNGWDGDSTFWRVEQGAIVGETTPDKPLKENTFLVWRGGTTKDFELTLEFRMSTANPAGNSGVQFRSSLVPDTGRWVMKGYQADIDAANTYTGQIYEERGRGFLAKPGQAMRVAPDGRLLPLGTVGDPAALRSFVKRGDWNALHVIAQGNVMTVFVNGHVTSLLVDDDPRGRAMDGLLGLQLHAGAPMKIEFRRILLK